MIDPFDELGPEDDADFALDEQLLAEGEDDDGPELDSVPVPDEQDYDYVKSLDPYYWPDSFF